MFDQSMTVHIGTDEYYGEKNRFRMFSDDLIEYVQSKGLYCPPVGKPFFYAG